MLAKLGTKRLMKLQSRGRERNLVTSSDCFNFWIVSVVRRRFLDVSAKLEVQGNRSCPWGKSIALI